MADPEDADPASLEREADERWWAGDFEASLALRQRAYAAFSAAGDPYAAAVGVRLSFEHGSRAEPAIAAGWLQRAEHEIADVEECVSHGYVAMGLGYAALMMGDAERAAELSERATEIGRRFGDRDLTAMSIHAGGRIAIARGNVRQGLAMLDEAMTSVVSGELGPHFTGLIYCSVLDACLELADIGRAGEWNDAATAWCATLPETSPFNGLCRINRARVASLRGAWTEAEAHASVAIDTISFEPSAAGRAWYETGEIRRRVGDVDGAESCFARARSFGHDPQPGLALLRAAQGKLEGATQALRLSLDAAAGMSERVWLLGAQVELAIDARDLVVARAAADELDTIASTSAVPAVDAAASVARGRLLLAEGDADGAVERLRHAAARWQELRMPYEAARARAVFGLALRAAGDEDGAAGELGSALAGFEDLGAAPEATIVRARLHGTDELPGGLTVREAEVLRLVATGRTNRDIAVELVLSEHTVARHLQNIYAKLGVGSRAAATAFAFANGLA